MHRLAEKCGLPADDIEFTETTFSILALAREYSFRPLDESIE